MKFKKKFEYQARDQTGSNEITTAWQDLILPCENSRGVWKEEKKND